MKCTSLVILIALINGSCNHKNSMEDHLPAKKGIILSCLRCGCMEKLLVEYAHRNGFSNPPIYTDTNCLDQESTLKHSIQLSQSKLDSLYNENYNIILFKKRNGALEYRVINTNEVLSFNKIKDAFFEDGTDE